MIRIIRLILVTGFGLGLVALFIIALPTSAAREASSGVDILVPLDDNPNRKVLDTRRVTVDAMNVEYIGHTGGPVYAATVVGNYAYIGKGANLTILDISQPSTPIVIGRSDFLPGNVQDIVLVGNYIYLAGGDGGLLVTDLLSVIGTTVSIRFSVC